jgi:hypothetical protein
MVVVPARDWPRGYKAGRIDFLESIPFINSAALNSGASKLELEQRRWGLMETFKVESPETRDRTLK